MTLARAVLAALVFWAAATLGAAAQTFPALSGRVVDGAGILSPEAEARLTQASAALEQQTGAQLVVGTVASLQDYPIEDYANRLFRAWRLGQREQNNGVLFLVAPNDRAVRIEVGYGLEPVLTDALSAVIIQGQVLPRFREGEMEAGVIAGAEAIAEQLGLSPEAAQARVAQAEARQQAQAESGGGGGGAGIVIALLLLWFVFSALSSFGRRGRRHRRRGGLAGDVAQVVLWSMINSGGRGGGWGGGGGGFGGGGFGGGGGSSGGGGASGSW
jgi:uncharacterized protein